MIRKFFTVGLALVFLASGTAYAHQPVVLSDSDTTAAMGPLLVDGTVSFAVRAAFTKAGEKKAFRAQFKAGDRISVQYLIVDKKPENKLKTTDLPSLVITAPSGSSMALKLKERTKFYEPFSKVNYLYLARYNAMAQAGVYSFVITSKGKDGITVAVGDREVRGEVLRGAAPTPSQSPTQTPFVPGYTLAEVKKNNSAASCWTIVEDSVYNLTSWINGHPGGANAILSLCGTDGTSAFKAQHENAGRPNQFLGTYKIGPLKE